MTRRNYRFAAELPTAEGFNTVMLSSSSARSGSSLLDHQLSVDPLSLLAVDASSRRLDLDHRPRGASAYSLLSA